jgi:YYY domain-containing protein
LGRGPFAKGKTFLRSAPKGAIWDRLLLTGVAALVTGTLFPLNTWDFPTYTAIVIGVFLLLELLPAKGEPDAPRQWDFSFNAIRRAAIWSAATVIGGRVLFWPYFTHYETPNSGFDKWAQDATRPGQYLIIHGVLLFFVVSYLLVEIGSSEGLRWQLPLIRPSLFKWRPVGELDGKWTVFAQLDYMRANFAARPLTIAAATFAIVTFASLWSDRITPLLLALIALAGLAAWRRRRESLRLFFIAMTGIAFCLSLAVEHYALHGDIGRMNTVFKFYLQVWMLLGLVAAIGAAMAVVRARRQIGIAGRVAWSIAGAFLILAGLIYPVLATPGRLDDRFNQLPRTLNGMAYMESATYDDNPHDNNQIVSYSLAGDDHAITWLQDNIAGSPVVLEGNTPLYRWGSRVSVYTGLPDVIGWDWHQKQQRMSYSELVDIRLADVHSMLNDAVPFAKIAPLLDKYHVQLIYIGALERAYYDAAGLQKFAAAAAAGQLTVIYQAEGVTIYRYAGGS